MCNTLFHVLVGLCIYEWPKIYPWICPQWVLLRRTAEKLRITQLKAFPSVLMCWHFMRSWAQAKNYHGAGPISTIFYLGNVRNEMLVFLEHSFSGIDQFSANNSCFVWASSCQFRKFVSVTGLNVQRKERMHRQVHFRQFAKCGCQICACIRERCAVLGDKWVVLATDCGIKDHPLISQQTTPLAHAITYLAFNSVCNERICSLVHPEQYWVHGRAIAVASILMCHVWTLLAY